MFECKNCLGKHFDEHFSRSYGPCEGCNKTSTCVDCHCPYVPTKKKKKNKKGK